MNIYSASFETRDKVLACIFTTLLLEQLRTRQGLVISTLSPTISDFRLVRSTFSIFGQFWGVATFSIFG